MAIKTVQTKISFSTPSATIELADLIMMCEDKFGIEISEDDSNAFVTVGDVVNYLENL